MAGSSCHSWAGSVPVGSGSSRASTHWAYWRRVQKSRAAAARPAGSASVAIHTLPWPQAASRLFARLASSSAWVGVSAVPRV